MAGFSDRARPSAHGTGPLGDVVVTVAASEVRDSAGRPIKQTSATTEARRTVGALRKERAGLAHRYQELRGDLGGLLIEMARRDQFNFHLLRLRAAEAVEVEQRAREIDGALSLHVAGTRQTLPTGSIAMPVMACLHCSAQIPADANFCAYCGAPPR